MRDAWWKSPEPHNGVTHLAEEIRDREKVELWKCRIHEAVYEAEPVSKNLEYRTLRLFRGAGFSAAALNVTRNMVDTLVAKLGTKEVSVKATTTDAEWEFKRKARQLTRFVAGKKESAGYNVMRIELVRDMCIYGTAVVQVAPEFGDIVIDRVPRSEILVDSREARYGKPRQLIRERTMSREKLAAMFPKNTQAIMSSAQATLPSWEEESDCDNNMLAVREAWHLPSAPGASDGCYVICIEGETLLKEPWKRQRFPFGFMHYARPRTGIWGKGLVEQLVPLQHKINEAAKDLQETLYFAGQSKMVVRRGSGVTKNHLGRGARPFLVEVDNPNDISWQQPSPVFQQQLTYLQFLMDTAYELAGVSKLSAQSQKPPGLQSGIALQEYYDIQSERFAEVEKNMALCDVEVANLLIDEAKSLSEDNGEFHADWADQTLIHRIKWSEVDMERDQFRMQLEPTSFLPETRAGKLQLSEKLAEMGIIQGEEIGSLLGGHPDIDRAMRRRNAPLNAILHHVELLQDESADLPTPDSHMNLQLAMEVMASEYNDAIAEDAPEEVLERFDEYMQLLENLIKESQPAPQQPMASDGVPPQPPPMDALPPGAAPEALPGQALPGLA